MAKDPVCGMEVEEKQAHNQTQYRGKAYYFCTPRCKEFFDRDPERYLRAPEGDLLDKKMTIKMAHDGNFVFLDE